MKMSTDFDTDSSSSSFILARKGELNQKQKDAVVDFVERTFLGDTILTPGMSEKEIEENMQKACDFAIEYADEAKEALKEGMSVSSGYVSFEECSYHITSLYEELWEILEKEGDGNFRVIDGNLDY